jgi:hypothetical protein
MDTNVSTPLDDNPRDVIDSERFRWSQGLESFRTSESETGANGKNSEDPERVGKTTEHGLLYTD